MVFGRPFIEETGLVYNKGEGMVMFEQNDEKITFKMPHTMEIFRQTKLIGLSTDSIPPFAHKENFGHGRMHYYQSLLIGDEYKQDGGISHLEDIWKNSTLWVHLEKKQTRLRTNTKTLKDLYSQSLETASQAIHDAVTTHQVTASHHFKTASACTNSNADLEDSSYDGVTIKM
ncbi:hypothetical protein Tco_0717521 [Tanacetum coccineum]